MAFNTQEQEIIKYGIANGKSKDEVSKAIANYRSGVVPQKKSESIVAEPSLGSKLATTAKDTVSNIGDVASRVKSGETGLTSATIQGAGALAGGALGATGDVLTSTPVVKDVVSAVAKPLTEGLKATQDWLANNPTFQKAVTSEQADKIASVLDAHPDLARNAQAIDNIANAVLLMKGGLQAAGDVASTVKKLTSPIGNISNLKEVLPTNVVKKATDLISADPGKKVETILKRTSPEELNNYLSIAEKSSISGEAKSVFEAVGDKLAETTKTLKTKLDSIGAEKSNVVLQNGAMDFTSQTSPLVTKLQEIRNSFTEIDKSNSGIVDSFIADAKNVKTTAQADAFIDKAQDALYTGSRNLTLPKGSALEGKLQRAIGEYNNQLKSVLPTEYTLLNEQYSKLVDTLGTINKSLGDVVEGVPIRGASLIKQYFSPAGSKTKEIFDFIKKETNGEVDLAKDATLAKFAGQLYDDPNVGSLLGGIKDIPTSIPAAAGRVIEKIGGDKITAKMRESTIRKARKTMSKPKEVTPKVEFKSTPVKNKIKLNSGFINPGEIFKTNSAKINNIVSKMNGDDADMIREYLRAYKAGEPSPKGFSATFKAMGVNYKSKEDMATFLNKILENFDAKK